MKKKTFRIIGYIVGSLILLIIILLISLKTLLPNVGVPPEIEVSLNEESIKHGEYLSNHVMICMDCHSQRDWSRFSGPPVPGTLGKGGEEFNEEMGFPGRYVATNLTPFALDDWTDGEIFRAITSGVNKDENALFPIMPYLNYGRLDTVDIYAVIAYLRTLESIEYEPEKSYSNFPMNFIINTIPKKARLSSKPLKNDRIEYGEYISLASGCMDCHTRMEGGKLTGEPYAGGTEFRFPGGSVTRSPNLTPHQTGLGNWTKEQFIERFKIYADSSYTPPKVNPGEFQSTMPWIMYADIREDDLGALFTYLQNIEPVDNLVVRFEPPVRN